MLLFLMFTYVLLGTEREACSQDSSPEEITKLIAELNAEQVGTREAAERRLLGMGRSILKQLSGELKRARDNETRSRLRNVIEQLTPVRLESILARVRAIAASDDWKKDGWKDPQLEALLTRLMAKVRKATELKHLRLPVDFDEVHPVGNAAGLLEMNKGRRLLVSRGGKVTSVKRGILLVDGAVDVSIAEDSIIIATLSAQVYSGNRNIVLAGMFAGSHRDGSDDYSKYSAGSLIVSGSVVDVNSSYGTVCAAPDLIQASSPKGVVFLNAKEKVVTFPKSCRNIHTDDLALAFRGVDNPLKDKLAITGTVLYATRKEKILFDLPDGTGPYVGRMNAPFTRPDGTVIESLKGWRLTVAFSSSYFLFEREKQVAAFVKREKRFVPLTSPPPRKK